MWEDVERQRSFVTRFLAPGCRGKGDTGQGAVESFGGYFSLNGSGIHAVFCRAPEVPRGPRRGEGVNGRGFPHPCLNQKTPLFFVFYVFDRLDLCVRFLHTVFT